MPHMSRFTFEADESGPLTGHRFMNTMSFLGKQGRTGIMLGMREVG